MEIVHKAIYEKARILTIGAEKRGEAWQEDFERIVAMTSGGGEEKSITLNEIATIGLPIVERICLELSRK
jgi:hypothetical protein